MENDYKSYINEQKVRWFSNNARNIMLKYKSEWDYSHGIESLYYKISSIKGAVYEEVRKSNSVDTGWYTTSALSLRLKKPNKVVQDHFNNARLFTEVLMNDDDKFENIVKNEDSFYEIFKELRKTVNVTKEQNNKVMLNKKNETRTAIELYDQLDKWHYCNPANNYRAEKQMDYFPLKDEMVPIIYKVMSSVPLWRLEMNQ